MLAITLKLLRLSHGRDKPKVSNVSLEMRMVGNGLVLREDIVDGCKCKVVQELQEARILVLVRIRHQNEATTLFGVRQ